MKGQVSMQQFFVYACVISILGIVSYSLYSLHVFDPYFSMSGSRGFNAFIVYDSVISGSNMTLVLGNKVSKSVQIEKIDADCYSTTSSKEFSQVVWQSQLSTLSFSGFDKLPEWDSYFCEVSIHYKDLETGFDHVEEGSIYGKKIPGGYEAAPHSVAAIWHFDEGKGTLVKDSSGNGNSGKIIGLKLTTVTSTTAGTSAIGSVSSTNDTSGVCLDTCSETCIADNNCGNFTCFKDCVADRFDNCTEGDMACIKDILDDCASKGCGDADCGYRCLVDCVPECGSPDQCMNFCVGDCMYTNNCGNYNCFANCVGNSTELCAEGDFQCVKNTIIACGENGCGDGLCAYSCMLNECVTKCAEPENCMGTCILSCSIYNNCGNLTCFGDCIDEKAPNCNGIDVSCLKNVLIQCGDEGCGSGQCLYSCFDDRCAPRCNQPDFCRQTCTSDCIDYKACGNYTCFYNCIGQDVDTACPGGDVECIKGLITNCAETQGCGDAVCANECFADICTPKCDTSSAVPGALWTSGISGTGLYFDGTKSYVIVPNSASLSMDGEELTIEAWVKWAINPATGQNWANIVNKGGDDEYQLQHNIFNDKFEFAVTTNKGRSFVQSTTTPTKDVWYQVVGVYNVTEIRIYVNGKFEASAPLTGKIAVSNSGVNIGRAALFNGRYFRGVIDEVRIYRYALSDKDVMKRYTSVILPTSTTVTEGSNSLATLGTSAT